MTLDSSPNNLAVIEVDGDDDDLEPVDAIEVTGVARIDREVVGKRGRRDQRVVGAGSRLASRATERGGDAAERAGGLVVERERGEVSFGLLEVGQSDLSFVLIGGQERTDGKLREGDRGDERFSGEALGAR